MEIIRLEREVCVRCSKPREEWNNLQFQNTHKIYCCEECEKNEGCTCEIDNEVYLAVRAFA